MTFVAFCGEGEGERGRGGELPITNPQPSTVNYQLSTINCQLSTVNCQLSTINCQLFIHIL
ncbi:MAG: hypothetical protein HC786_22800 [Richelia sp. CSU_2_1]|nr:hypothetical protein [Richelia sp. CSU_2_1]